MKRLTERRHYVRPKEQNIAPEHMSTNWQKQAENAQCEFVWGPIVATHQIGDILVIENHPQIFKNNCGTGRYDYNRTEFHPYLKEKGKYRSISESYHSLDMALIGAIAHKYDGLNTRAHWYFSKMVGINIQ